MLGGTQGVARWSVHHDDALASRCIFIDVICSYAGPHDRFESSISVEGFGSDLDPTANNRSIELRQGLLEFLAFESVQFLVLKLRVAAQHRETFRSYRIQYQNASLHNVYNLGFFSCFVGCLGVVSTDQYRYLIV